MKKSFFLSSLVLSVCLVGMVFVSCKSDNKPKHDKEFLDALEQGNSRCPIEVAGGLATFDAMKLEDENVTFYATFHQDINPLLKSGDKAKEALVVFILGGNPNSSIFLDKIIDEKCGIRLVATEPDGNKTTVTITADELKQFRDRFRQNPQESTRKMLEMQLETERSSLPMEVEEGMTLVDYSVEKDNIIYVAEIDESLYSIEDFKENESLIKTEIIGGLHEDPQTKMLVSLCKSSNMGLVYRLVGKTSKKKIDILISSDEL